MIAAESPFSHKVLGLTGNPGAGKSAASEYMKNHGAIVVSGDEIGYQMLLPGSPVIEQLVQIFGESIRDANNGVSRKALGGIVFNQPEKLARLNEVVHPPMLERIKGKIDAFRASDEKGPFVLDAALIYEWQIENWFDYVIAVVADDDIRRRRFEQARGNSSAFDQREAAQISQAEKMRKADCVIDNNGGLDHLRFQIDQLFKSNESDYLKK